MTKIWQRVHCPYCHAPKGDRCRALTTGRVTDTHESRFAEFAELNRREWGR